MSNAADILRANGMGLADELVRAAALEGMPVPIAATVIAGESWGRNIWGADNVDPGGTYTKHGAVTQANYLAYRSAMRAGRIKRQGCGPAQCTSAQYQDTADALGGCWDPVANMRSGFRGMGALMKAYGTRDGARRYNGSGPQAEAYAASFMNRLAVWQARLAGASVTPAPTPPPAPAPAPARPTRSDDDMRDRFLAGAFTEGRFTGPFGGRSATTQAAWITASCIGTAQVKVWCQQAGGDDRKIGMTGGDADWQIGPGDRRYLAIPDDADWVEYQVLNATRPGDIRVDELPRK